MSYFNQISIKSADSASIDAFARQRVSNPQTIFDSKLTKDKQSLFWDESVGANTTSTYNTNQASVTLATTGAGAGTVIRQTKQRFNYQPGKSQLIFLTGIIGAAATSCTKRVGIFDANNGIFLQQAPTGVLSWNIRTFTSGSAVDTSVVQSSWNLDKLDGTGVSGKTLDVTKTQILVIDYEWLGVGRVRVGFVIDGIPVYTHQFLNANSNTLVYMSTPNLPLRWELVASASNPTTTLTAICSTVISEGGSEDTGLQLSLTRDTAFTTLNNASYYPLMALRLKSTHLDATIDIKQLTLVCTSTATYAYKLILNPTVTGAALSFTALTNSALEYDIATTNASTVTGGTELFGAVSQATTIGSESVRTPSTVRLGSTIAGTSDILVLAVARVTGIAETFYSSLNWTESY